MGRPSEWLPASFGLLLLYCLIRAVVGSVKEVLKRDERSVAGGFAALLTAWGATLQVAFLASALSRSTIEALLRPTVYGSAVLEALKTIEATSPWSFLPSGLTLFGITLFIAARWGKGYHGKTYAEVLPTRQAPPILRPLIDIIRLPTWLFIGALVFLGYLAKQVILSLGDFLLTYVSRLLLVIAGLVLPVGLMTIAHHCSVAAVVRIHDYLSSDALSWPAGLWLFAQVHLLVLASMSLFVVCVIPLPLEITPISIRTAVGQIWRVVTKEGLPAADALGKGCQLYGIIALAVPITVTLRSGPKFGPFSAVYLGVLLCTFALAMYRKPGNENASEE